MADKQQQPNFPAEPTTKTKRKTVFEKAVTKKRLDHERGKTRINIGSAFTRWRQLRQAMGMKDDTMVALFLLDRVCGKTFSPTRKKGRPRKSTPVPAPQTEESESDSTHTRENHRSSNEDEDMEASEICYTVPPSCQTDESSQNGLKSEDQLKTEHQLMCEDQIKTEHQLMCEDQIKKTEEHLDQDICKAFVSPTENADIISQTTKEIKDEPIATTLESRHEVSASPAATSDKIDHGFVQTPNLVTVENRVGHRDRSLVSKKSHLPGLFPTCLQCGGPVLEYTTVLSGNQNRLQWTCSKGHLMWLVPNMNPS